MAKKNTMKEDVYDVVDKDGNVVTTLKYGEGSQMYNEAKAARETGGTYQVYESQGHDAELYPSVSSAKVDVSLDAKNGKIKLTGPKWLTSEFKNSDSFKQVVSENKALSKLINLYQQDPNAKLSTKDGGTMTVAAALQDFEDAANELGSAYGQNIAAKDRIANAYGTSLNDEQLSIAYSGQIKDSDTYDKKGTVYIPKWAMGKYNWSSLASYDADNRTVSAEDFFENVYSASFSKDGSIDFIKDLRQSAEDHMRDYLDNNTYDHSDSGTVSQKEEELGSDDYKEEFARSRAFYTYLTQNSPDTSGALKVAFWASGFVNTLTKELSMAGVNLTADMAKLFESTNTAFGVFDENAVSDTLTVINPAYWSAVWLGELYTFLGEGGNIEEYQKNYQEIVGELNASGEHYMLSDILYGAEQKISEDFKAQDYEVRGGTKADELLKEYSNFAGIGGNAAKNGAFWGHMAYKVIENMAFLNMSGQGVSKILLGTGKPLAKFVALFMPDRAVSALRFAANVGTQGLLETYIDDRDLVNAAFAQGELTPDLMSAIERNTMWNAVGEASPIFYENVVIKTTPGKMLDMGLKKMAAGAGLAKNRAKKPFFTWLNKFKTADAAGGIAESAGKTVAQYTTEYFDAVAKAQKAILNMPIMKELTEEQKQIIKDASAYILTGKTVAELEKNGEEFQKDLVDEMFKKADTLEAGVGQNYEYMQKVILSRMNLENNFDAILRGDRAKLEHMNAFAGKSFDEYTSSLTKTLEMEQQAIRNGAKLTARDVGSLMTKESAETLSYMTQLGRYEAQLAAGKFAKAADAAQAEAYVRFMRGRLGELRNTLGDSLYAQLENHLTSMGRYYKSLQDYMIAKGYLSDEVKNLISELRSDTAGWGKGGERYIPTARLFGNNEYRVDVKALLDDVSEGSLLKGKTYADDLKQYKIGGSEDSFMDPTMVLYAHARQMAKTAQGIDMWRSLRANNLLSRSIKSFDEDGFSQFETDLMAKSAKGMEKDFKSIFDAKGKEVFSATRDAFTTGNALKEGYESAQTAATYKQMATQVDKDLTLSAKRSLMTDASVEDVEAVLANAPSYMSIPQFSLDGINAANFKEWYDAFPEGVQNRLVTALGGKSVDDAAKELSEIGNGKIVDAHDYITSDVKEGYKNFIAANVSKRDGISKDAEKMVYEFGFTDGPVAKKPINKANKGLREGKKSISDIAESLKKKNKSVDDIEKILSDGSHELTNDTIAYRVVSTGGNAVNKGDMKWLSSDSGEFSDPAFMFVTLDEQPVLKDELLYGSGDKYVLRIHAPEGTGVLMPTYYGVKTSNGGEFILTPNQKGKFVKTGEKNGDAEYVDVYLNGWKMRSAAKKSVASATGARKLNVTNVKALYKENPEIELDLKRAYIQSSGKDSYRIWDSASNRNYIRERAVANLNAEGNTLQKDIAAQYRKAKEALDGKPFKIADPSTYNADFTAQIKRATNDVKDSLIEAIKKNQDTAGNFNAMVERLTRTGLVSEEQAEAYAVYYHLNKLKADDIKKALRSTGDNLTSAADKAARAAKIPRNQQEVTDKVTNAVARGIKSNIESEFNQLQNLIKSAGAGDAMDLNLYWKELRDLEKQVYEDGGKWLRAEDKEVMDRHIVQAVNGEGKLQYYEVDPSTAFLVNARPNYSKEGANKLIDIATAFNSTANQIFRLGTTGMDRISYVNQWFRDTINAIIVGGARPFTDLGTGGVKSTVASVASDYIPFGQKIFGKAVSERIGSEVVESTYKAAREGLEMEFGSDFVKSLEDNAASGLEGAAATAAKKRAVVDYTIKRSGYESLPSSGMREAEVYRTTTARGTGKPKTEAEVRAEEFDRIIDGGDQMAQFNRKMKKMKSKIDDLMSDNLSKGSWRENFLRKSVFTSQYNLAIKSGMTSQEAQIWASRYAMDATTNFGRPFAFGNSFMRNVPYLGAAFNGTKSFYRLLELDPVGVSSRLTFGLILPYMMTLSESLSDPNARELYKQVPEYEKEDNFVLFFRGSMVKIPVPQELSAFLSPFRHMVEKASDANDASWVNLVTSDALGILPLDMSGFAEISANDILAEGDSKTGLWTHVKRGTEKMMSSLMGPVVKSAYMYVSGKDPYTGREIDRSYKTIDDEGNAVVMDSTQSELAQMLKGKGIFKGMSASSTYAVLKALMGRSTMSVLDEGISLFSGQAVDDKGNFRKLTSGEWVEEHFNEFGEQVLKPIGVSEPNYGAEVEWRTAVNKLYDAREALVNDEGFAAAYRTLQSPSASEEKKAGALASYREMLDSYSKQVLDTAKNLQAKYPDAYTRTREAQVVSLLTLPTGLTYNDTAYAADLRNEEYYDAKAQAVATYAKMGFPDTNPSETMLGRGYFDGQGKYQFKVYTPYEIQFIQDAVFGMASEVSAQVDQVMGENKIKSGDMWDLYHSTNDKTLRKKIMGQWNAKVVPLIAPIIEKYGADAVLGNSSTRDTITKYIYTSNPYKKKEYLYEIFGEEQ